MARAKKDRRRQAKEGGGEGGAGAADEEDLDALLAEMKAADAATSAGAEAAGQPLGSAALPWAREREQERAHERARAKLHEALAGDESHKKRAAPKGKKKK